ncbi:hypothetical protein NBRC110019_17380 [Neptunitalea chrysea]|uniref:Por secretion system C-terminal sorting domain-containing protein n=1 Tax=Neptunitalea chrysea TaxID=1647581 RepID=A0A9W6B4W6_9FLAO|nr:M12 family metallo-peptidase [Neptunitalea chrysea]GLB52698.1 hypothetical protein NBRC110019_17380 [Neptunitalea chrysea]
MKKILLFSCLIFGAVFFANAQQEIAKKVKELEKTGADFKHFSVLNVDASVETLESSKAVTEAVYATLNTSAVSDIVTNAYETIEIEIPYLQQNIVAKLYKVNLFTDNFNVDTDKETNVNYTPGVYYRGVINGESTSVVSFNFFANEVNGILSGENVGNIVVGELDNDKTTPGYIIYDDQDLVTGLNFECHTEDNGGKETDNHEGYKIEGTANVATTNCVTLYLEIDNDIYVQNSSDVTATTNWMTSVFNNVQTLYTNDGITVALNDMFIWTSTDPFTGTSSSENLSLFYQNRDIVNGDLGMLVGIDSGGLGGLASTIDGLCSSENRAYSDVSYYYSTVPTYSWTVQVITHEFGHLLGSRHTHACVWNNDNTAIDGCGQQAGYSEGSCAEGSIPNAGSIMSYCHLISGVGINFSIGFGNQPSNVIINTIDGSNCLSSDCSSPCVNQVYNVQFSNITQTSATITWDSYGGESQFEVAVSPYNFPLATYSTVTGYSYVANGLTSNTYYKVRIRPVCTNSTATPASNITILGTNGDVCSGFVFADQGGTSGQYVNSETVIRTFTPEQTGKATEVTFTSFNTEEDYDFMYIYDGSDTNSTLLTPGGLSGSSNPGTFTSTAADGALTFEFIPDSYSTAAGWEANVSCVDSTFGLDKNEQVDFSYYPNPTSGEVSITAASQIEKVEVYSTTGQLLYTALPGLTTANVNLAKFAAGTYFFAMDVAGTTVNFKVVKY